MRRPLFATLSCLLGLFWLIAPSASGAERGALFRISQGTHVMHLFGTLHVGLPEFYPLEPRITEAIAESSTLALELDPDQPRSTKLAALRDYGMLAPDTPGYAALTPEQKARLDKLIRQGGLDAGTALHYKPVLLGVMLTLADTTRQGYQPDWATEYVLARLAHRKGLRVIGLESLGGQLAMLDRLAQRRPAGAGCDRGPLRGRRERVRAVCECGAAEGTQRGAGRQVGRAAGP
jgi:uncharacterized protein YbaP (TraB family)